MLKRILNYALAVLVVLACGAGGGWVALAIGSPAVADDIDILVFILLGLLAGWALLALLSSLRHLPTAWRNWRAGIALPVLMKEMRPAIRGRKMPALILISAGLAVMVGGLVLAAGLERTLFEVNENTLGGQLVRAILLLGALLVLVLAPGLTAGAVSGEREKGTLEMLLLTRMSPGQILWGKLLSGLSVLGMILLCMLPVAAVGFMLGGVAGWQMLAAVGMLAAVALCFGAVGLWCSTRFRRTAVAVTIAYLLCIGLVIIVPFCSELLFTFENVLLLPILPILGWLLLAAALEILLAVGLSRLAAPYLSRRGKWIYSGLLFALLLAIFVEIGNQPPPQLPYTPVIKEDWDAYIEYLDPGLAFSILLDPNEEVGYPGLYYEFNVVADFDSDWPIILSNLAVFLLVAKLMLTLTRRRLQRLRQPESPTRKAPA